MYRFTPSAQPVYNPLQGLIGLGAVSSYYRMPVYSCAQNANVIEYAQGRCASRAPDKVVDYKRGYSTTMKGTKDKPYQITIKDIYNNLFDSCRVKAIKTCPIEVTPSELVVLPVPTHLVPTPPPPPPPQKPPPVEVTPEELTQLPVPKPYPVYTAPSEPPVKMVASESTPMIISSLPTVSKAGVVVNPQPQIEPEVEEEEESTSGKYLVVGGILLLVVGGGAAYYFTRKRK